MLDAIEDEGLCPLCVELQRDRYEADTPLKLVQNETSEPSVVKIEVRTIATNSKKSP